MWNRVVSFVNDGIVATTEVITDYTPQVVTDNLSKAKKFGASAIASGQQKLDDFKEQRALAPLRKFKKDIEEKNIPAIIATLASDPLLPSRSVPDCAYNQASYSFLAFAEAELKSEKKSSFRAILQHNKSMTACLADDKTSSNDIARIVKHRPELLLEEIEIPVDGWSTTKRPVLWYLVHTSHHDSNHLAIALKNYKDSPNRVKLPPGKTRKINELFLEYWRFAQQPQRSSLKKILEPYCSVFSVSLSSISSSSTLISSQLPHLLLTADHQPQLPKPKSRVLAKINQPPLASITSSSPASRRLPMSDPSSSAGGSDSRASSSKVPMSAIRGREKEEKKKEEKELSDINSSSHHADIVPLNPPLSAHDQQPAPSSTKRKKRGKPRITSQPPESKAVTPLAQSMSPQRKGEDDQLEQFFSAADNWYKELQSRVWLFKGNKQNVIREVDTWYNKLLRYVWLRFRGNAQNAAKEKAEKKVTAEQLYQAAQLIQTNKIDNKSENDLATQLSQHRRWSAYSWLAKKVGIERSPSTFQEVLSLLVTLHKYKSLIPAEQKELSDTEAKLNNFHEAVCFEYLKNRGTVWFSNGDKAKLIAEQKPDVLLKAAKLIQEKIDLTDEKKGSAEYVLARQLSQHRRWPWLFNFSRSYSTCAQSLIAVANTDEHKPLFQKPRHST